MRDRLRAIVLIAVSLAAGAAAGRAQDLCDGKAAELRKAIEAHGAKWVSRLPGAEPTMTGLELAPIDAPFLPMTEAAAPVLPKRFDWREHNAVSGVRDQGACGSCWAFSMTQALESQVMIANKSSEDPKLSEQVMISCSGTGSCNGGKMNATFIQNVGLPPESDYPYTATDGNCSDAKSGWQQRAHRIGSWYSVPHNLAAIKSALVAHGPLPITLDLRKDMKYYQSGVYTYIKGDQWGCGGKDSAGRDNDEWGWHAVLLVGYDDDGQYFIVKNSWGPGWGENGYFRIAYSEMFTKAFFGNETLAYLTSPARAAEVAAAPGGTETTAAAASRPAEAARYGIGAQLYADPASGAVLVQAVAPGGSAETQGLREGDRIVAVDPAGDGHFVKTTGLELARVVKLILGERHTTLVLRVARAGAAGAPVDIPLLRSVELSATGRIEQDKQELHGLAGKLAAMSDADYARDKGLRPALIERFPKAAAALASRSGALGVVHKTLAACEYAQALQLGASYAAVQRISRALKDRLADPALLEGPAVVKPWSALADNPPAPNAVEELQRQALSHYNAGRYEESLSAGPASAAEPAASEVASSDVLAGSILSSTAESGAGGPQCIWTQPSCGVCACESLCLYCKADPSLVACGGARPRCPVPKMITGLQLRAEPETLTSDSPVTLTAVLSFSESVTSEEKQQVSVEFSADGADSASVGFGAGSAPGPFKANVDANGAVQVPVHLVPNVAADEPKNAEKEEPGSNSEARDHAGAAFDSLDAESNRQDQNEHGNLAAGAPAPIRFTVTALPPGRLPAAPNANLRAEARVYKEAKTGTCTEERHVTLQDDVDKKCSEDRSCSSRQDCAELMENLAKCQACYAARKKIIDECYGGKPTDAEHKKMLDEAEMSVKSCEDEIAKKIEGLGNAIKYKCGKECAGDQDCGTLEVNLALNRACQAAHSKIAACFLDPAKSAEHQRRSQEAQGSIDNCQDWIAKKCAPAEAPSPDQ